ncbi:phospholipase A and acyltransferase 3-like [Haliotis rufescens]|uniref:phospholipase A and acyltransferase 3-like n=1 Tax=Haliotis rufescens TaxID=6454 RepID=UPI00201F7EC0|nr:phospholipase A and acyltransferase 3-like [Haliotis rufescens]
MSSREVRRHNQTVLESLEPGDLVQIRCRCYWHWAVYVGDNQVVHLSVVDGPMGSNIELSCSICGQEFNKGIVRKDGFWEVVGDGKAYKNNSKDKTMRPLEPSEIVERAKSKIGEVGYNVIFKNCEHFATGCRYDKKKVIRLIVCLVAA